MTPRAALNALLASDNFQALEARVRRLSAFHILGIETREVSHAALLAWLLDPRASHGMGAEPLRRFILLAVRLDSTEGSLDAVDIDELDLSDALTETEVWIDIPDSKRRRRLDVLVSLTHPGDAEARPVLVVEYKVDAGEGEGQTADYARWASTQSIRLGDRELLPLQVYLCPVANDEKAPAAPFVTVGYDAHLGWVEAVARLEMTSQARFLLDEWRACLQVRNDVMDEEQEALTVKLEKEVGDALQLLRNASRSDLLSYQLVMDQHADVLAQLGVRAGRRVGGSKGYSGAVARMRATLQATLDPELWRLRGAGGSLGATFLASIEKVASWAGSSVRYSGLRLQIFADRPKGGRLRVVLEVIGDAPGLDRDATVALRRAAAEELREVFGAIDPALTLRTMATCLSIDIAMPEVVDIASDTDENAAVHAAEMEAAAQRLAALEPALRDWCRSRIRELLQEA